MGEPALKLPSMTLAEYAAFEETSPERNTFWDGEIYAMAGASPTHIDLESSLFGRLFVALEGKPCRPYTGNCQICHEEAERVVYADAVVVCGERQFHPGDRCAVTNPTVIFEVLSPSTESFDRGDKLRYYRSFPSVTSVVMLSQSEVFVEHIERGPKGLWTLRDHGPGDRLHLPELGIELSVDAIYAGVKLAAAPVRTAKERREERGEG